VGVQSFNDELLRQMDRYEKYGDGMLILQRLQEAKSAFPSVNADMIFNFPSQTESMLIYDIAAILESGCTQITFYPLMASPAVERSLARTVGSVNYRREQRFYEIINKALTAGGNFSHGTAWTFNAARGSQSSQNLPALQDSAGAPDAPAPPDSPGAPAPPDAQTDALIDEYIINYEEYPAIGSGAFSYLNGALYVNTFSVRDYIKRVNAGRMSLTARKRFSKRDRMRYRLMMQLFGLRLDKRQWRRDFGCSVPAGVPAEYAFFKAAGAFASDNEDEITLSPKGRYLLLACMRQFFVGVNGLRDQARSALDADERELLFGC
jgi:coproporphyrinogen III oxidase-like Fe-S oxidoreductase